jgi:hypothetical protein
VKAERNWSSGYAATRKTHTPLLLGTLNGNMREKTRVQQVNKTLSTQIIFSGLFMDSFSAGFLMHKDFTYVFIQS